MRTNRASEKKSYKKKIFLLLFIIVNISAIVIPAVLEFCGENESLPFADLLNIIGGNWYSLIAAIGCFGLALFFESCKYDTMIYITTGKRQFVTAFEVSAIGKYYDFITPFGSGGQPFQIYYLNKRGLPPGASGALPVMGFLSNQIAFVLVTVAVFFTNSNVMKNVSDMNMLIPAYVGLITYMIVPLLVILFSVMPVTTQKIVAFFIRIFGKMHIIKNVEKTIEKACSRLEEYNVHMRQMKKNKGLYLAIFFFSLLFQIALNSIPFFVLCAFGVKTSFYDMFSLCAITYAAVSFVPTPGNGGAAEGMFMVIFRALSGGVLFWGMLIWRILSYYAFIAVGAMVTVMRSYLDKRKRQQITGE